ncbi:MAG: MFS transporter [Candidatus Gracilibacteria bacterium]|jgi:MFS family permease|nr:MFS transporter [Candidatus Gracilibacteria bacterium]
MKILSPKFAVLLTVFVGVLGIGIIIPILPFYIESYNVGAFVVTSFFSIFAFCAFLSAPVIGALSDRFGRRPVMILSSFATSVGWIVFASAGSLTWLFVGRIIEGVASGNISAANSYLSDISKDSKDRTANLGLLGAVFGIGFIIGPALGGFLSKISLSFPFYFAAFLSVIATLLSIFILPESIKEKSKLKVSFNPFAPLKKILPMKKFRHYFIVWFVFNFGISIMQSVFALYLFSAFGFRELGSSIILAVIGLIIAINQGLLLRKFWIKNFKEKDLLFFGLLSLSIAFFFFSIGYLWVFIIGLLMNAFSQSLLRIVITSEVSGLCEENVRGETLGVLMSLSSLCMTMAPLLAGFLFEINIKIPFVIASIISFFAFVLVYFERRKIKDIKEASPVIY